MLYVYASSVNMKAASRPVLPCLCASLRRTTRTLTHLYEEALRPLGLRSSQFTILQVLSRAGEMTQGELGRMLAMDSTTLTRTLEIMTDTSGSHDAVARSAVNSEDR